MQVSPMIYPLTRLFPRAGLCCNCIHLQRCIIWACKTTWLENMPEYEDVKFYFLKLNSVLITGFIPLAIANMCQNSTVDLNSLVPWKNYILNATLESITWVPPLPPPPICYWFFKYKLVLEGTRGGRKCWKFGVLLAAVPVRPWIRHCSGRAIIRLSVECKSNFK